MIYLSKIDTTNLGGMGMIFKGQRSLVLLKTRGGLNESI